VKKVLSIFPRAVGAVAGGRREGGVEVGKVEGEGEGEGSRFAVIRKGAFLERVLGGGGGLEREGGLEGGRGLKGSGRGRLAWSEEGELPIVATKLDAVTELLVVSVAFRSTAT